MMKRSFVILLLFCGFLTGVSAQRACTLDECINAAIERNRTLRSLRLEAEASLQTRREAFTNYFPQISATGGAFRAQHGLVQADFSIPMLGSLPVSMLKDAVFGGVMAIQPVFSGLRIVNGNKLARLGEEVARLQVGKTEAEVREQVEVYFWQIVSLRENLATLDAVDRQLAEIHRQVSLSVDAGLTTSNDLLRVELRQQEIASNRLKLENGLKVSKMLLAQYVGIDRRDFEVAEVSDFSLPESPAGCYVSADEAIDRRVEMRLSEKNLEAKRYQKRMERGKRLPSVGIGAGYLYNNFTEKDVAEGLVFASVSVPISDWWGGAHALKKARIEESRAENEQEQLREMLAVEIEKSWFDLLEAHAQIELMRKSVSSAEENLRQNRNFYEAGTGSLTDLLDAETLYTQSCNNLTAVCAAYRTALAGYMRVTGR